MPDRVEVKMQCDMCGSESTFRFFSDSLICNTCNTPIAVGAPAREKWEVYLKAIHEANTPPSQSTQSEFDRMSRDAEAVLHDEELEEEEEEYEEEEEVEVTEEENYRRMAEKSAITEHLRLTQGLIAILKQCEKIMADKNFIQNIPALPKAIPQFETTFARIKSILGDGNTSE